MRGPRATAAPRIIWIGDDPYLISAPSSRHYFLILNYLHDVIVPGPEHPADWIPGIDSEESSIALATDGGMAVLLYAVLARDNPEIRIRNCFHMIDRISPEDRERIQEIALARDRPEIDVDLSHWKGTKKSEGKPIHEVNFGEIYERADFRDFSPGDLAHWTIDQIENKLVGGEIDAEHIQKYGAPLNVDELAEWNNRANSLEGLAKVAAERGMTREFLAEIERRQQARPIPQAPKVPPTNLPELMPHLTRPT